MRGPLQKTVKRLSVPRACAAPPPEHGPAHRSGALAAMRQTASALGSTATPSPHAGTRKTASTTASKRFPPRQGRLRAKRQPSLRNPSLAPFTRVSRPPRRNQQAPSLGPSSAMRRLPRVSLKCRPSPTQELVSTGLSGTPSGRWPSLSSEGSCWLRRRWRPPPRLKHSTVICGLDSAGGT